MSDHTSNTTLVSFEYGFEVDGNICATPDRATAELMVRKLNRGLRPGQGQAKLVSRKLETKRHDWMWI